MSAVLITGCSSGIGEATARRLAAGGWTVTRSDPHAWYPASAPFPAASLASFRITTQGNVLVTISLRPGTQPTAAHASSVPASIPVT